MAVSAKNIKTSCPCPPCPPVPPEDISLYNSYEEAVIAVNRIRLKPGDSHVEFYLTDNTYHCVVGIGNINQGKMHLILTDNGSLGPISELIKNINSSINFIKREISTNKAEMLERIEDIENTISTYEAKFVNIENTLVLLSNNVSSNINKINASLYDLYNKINIINSSISSVILIVDSLNASINKNTLDIDDISNRLNNTNNYIANVSSNLDLTNNKVIDLSNNINRLDSSIQELYLRGIQLQPITDPSIDSLFEDIYTVNLCCYTNGGYVKVPDYSTYIFTDSILMTAYKKPGYVFAGWYKDASKFTDVSTIIVDFSEGDINVIGTALNLPLDRGLLLHGYSALFSALLNINTNIEVNPAFHEKTGDRLELTGVVDEHYVYEGSDVTIRAIPVDDTHVFDHFLIDTDGSTNHNPITIHNVSTNVNITAYFTELRYVVLVTENDENMGHGIGGGIRISGTKEVISAIPNAGYKFDKWGHRKSPLHSWEYIHGGNPVLEITYLCDIEYRAFFKVK